MKSTGVGADSVYGNSALAKNPPGRSISLRLFPLRTGIDSAAVKKFEERTAEDSAREWRALTPQEVTQWANALRPFHATGLYVFWNQEVEARKLFASIKAAAKQAGIP